MKVLICLYFLYLVCFHSVISLKLENSNNEGFGLTTVDYELSGTDAYTASSGDGNVGDEEEGSGDEGDDTILDSDKTVKVQPVVKPKNTNVEGRKKNKDKRKNKPPRKPKTPKIPRTKKPSKMKMDPCSTTHVDYCIYGQCTHIEDINETTCICNMGYHGERCAWQLLKTGSNDSISDIHQIVLVAIAVVLSAVSFSAVLVIFIIHCRSQKKFKETFQGAAEEKVKLQQENPASHIVVWKFQETRQDWIK
ncbi:amphiregulin [Polypterus senegalus]|uniref:amphiregulin n=1 Tax=Polypterus senegalus TaxID=55291 RepID=UPI0019650BD7|nr:amphiregulin [Polypterus senegalus]